MKLKLLISDTVLEFINYLLEDPEELDLTVPETVAILTLPADENI